jgi:hypothetical protein
MKKEIRMRTTLLLMLAGLVMFGCENYESGKIQIHNQGVAVSGRPETAQFATGWCVNDDPAVAAETAMQAAQEALGCEAKGFVFYTYYQPEGYTPEGPTAFKAAPNKELEAAVKINELAGGVPNIGCQARALTNGGTLLTDAVAVLAIGGEQIDIAATSTPIDDDRLKTGKNLAAAVKDVENLKIVVALAEPKLSFEAKEGVSVEDFIKGVIADTPEGVTLFGGNAMPNPGEWGTATQFINGKAINGHIVAMGIGGPLKVYANHTNEFAASEETVEVTKAIDKWIVELDGKPAEEVYRGLRGMDDDEEFTWDWQHPVGVVVAEDKVYLRMVLNRVKEDGTVAKEDEAATAEVASLDVPAGSLRLVAPVVEGTKIKALKGGDDAREIVLAAEEGILESIKAAKADNADPALALLSNCCARGMRLRTFREGNDDEVIEAIVPAMGEEVFPVFGFYAYGELGPISGEYQGMKHQYQQHTFVSAVVAIDE